MGGGGVWEGKIGNLSKGEGTEQISLSSTINKPLKLFKPFFLTQFFKTLTLR